MKSLAEILEIALPIAWGASDILRSYYQGTNHQNLDVQYKDEKDKDPVTAADLAVSHYILEKLQAALGNEDFGYISEETYQESQKVKQKWVWIIDPLDGTRDFIEKTGEYAIHIALVKDKRPVFAIVAVPESGKMYYATKGGGAFVEARDGKTEILQVSSGKKIEELTLVASRSHRNEKLDFILKNLPCKNQKSIGSVGCKIAAIVEKQADVYISLSGKSAPKDWDIAAPELILTEAGGKYTHFDGSPLLYNTGDINQWGGLLASNGEYHEVICQEAEINSAEWEMESGE
ncbi:MAG: 3'(2'),5'-bisphosphate nucleotidase CysQ [Scytonematopsis contorta HA4267-MV1]|jgi:3'(2'), 5'-bisphosphate nucleotidase|nr:3'(2'),5'-bisphosphate nucleotidase CysQ [Scytonematopsis contorta HA4267-MV1]